MTSEPDDPEAVAEEMRRILIEEGAQPRDLSPLPGEAERAERRLAEILQSPRAGTVETGPTHDAVDTRRRWWVRTSILAASAAALAVALMVPWSPSSPEIAVAASPSLLTFDATLPGELPAGNRPARDALMDLARLSGNADPGSSGPVQHVVIDAWWSSNEQTDEGVRSELIPVQSRTYFLPNGTMRSIERRGDPLRDDGTLGDPRNWSAHPVTADETFDGPDRGPDYAENLPTEPDALRETLVAAQDETYCAPTPGGCLMEDVIGLHHTYVPSPALTSALWKVLASEPSIYLVGATRDRLGRKAIAFMTRAPDDVSQLLLLADTDTGAFLGEERILVEPVDSMAFIPPAVTSFSALVEARRITMADVPQGP